MPDGRAMIAELPACTCDGDDDQHLESSQVEWPDGSVDEVPTTCDCNGFEPEGATVLARVSGIFPDSMFGDAVHCALMRTRGDVYVIETSGDDIDSVEYLAAKGALDEVVNVWLGSASGMLDGSFDWDLAIAARISGTLENDDSIEGHTPASSLSEAELDGPASSVYVGCTLSAEVKKVLTSTGSQSRIR